nr:PQQ-binding-like beta-propeller repeat protein [Streptomyces purpureus]
MEERPGGATLAWDEGDAVALYGLEGRTPSGRAERWTVSVPDGEESAARTLPAGTVSAATEVDKHLHVHTRRGVACEPLTAEGERWEFAADGDSVNVDQEPPTVVEDRVVFRYGEALYAVSRKYGGRLWKFVADGQITGRLSTAPRAGEEGSLLLFGTDQGTLYAVDSRSGKQVWRHAMPGDPVHGPVLDGDLLYAAQGRTLYALDVAGPRRG